MALEIHRSKLFVKAYPAELINADSTSQRHKTITGRKKIQWPGVLVFENFSEGIMISEHARIRILTLRVRWKKPRMGQICMVSDRKVDFSRNLGCALADFYGHYSSRDLHMCSVGLGLVLHPPPLHVRAEPAEACGWHDMCVSGLGFG